MLEREVVPEILDSLPADDPEAVRSRRDLRRIDGLMGNSRWILSALSELPREGDVHELGSGEGGLLGRLAEAGFEAHGYDLAPRPLGLPESVGWQQCDLLKSDDSFHGAVVASLFLHHFEEADLAHLGRRLARADLLAFAEPLRCGLALAGGYALVPFVGRVTRHDMMVSIRAGFRPGELPRALGLSENWVVEESQTLLGGYRLLAKRR